MSDTELEFLARQSVVLTDRIRAVRGAAAEGPTPVPIRQARQLRTLMVDAAFSEGHGNVTEAAKILQMPEDLFHFWLNKTVS